MAPGPGSGVPAAPHQPPLLLHRTTMSQRRRTASGLWKVREAGEEQEQGLSPADTRARGRSGCWGPLRLQRL